MPIADAAERAFARSRIGDHLGLKLSIELVGVRAVELGVRQRGRLRADATLVRQVTRRRVLDDLPFGRPAGRASSDGKRGGEK